MDGATPVYNEKKSQKFPSYFPFIAYLLNSNYEKSAKCNPTFRRDNFFSILPIYCQVSKHTAMLSEFSFPKKGKKLSLSFGCKFMYWWNQGFCRAMGNYTIENLNSFLHQTNKNFLN